MPVNVSGCALELVEGGCKVAKTFVKKYYLIGYIRLTNLTNPALASGARSAVRFRGRRQPALVYPLFEADPSGERSGGAPNPRERGPKRPIDSRTTGIARGRVQEKVKILAWCAGAVVLAFRPLGASYSRSSSSLTARIWRGSNSLTLMARQPLGGADRGNDHEPQPNSPGTPGLHRCPSRTPSHGQWTVGWLHAKAATESLYLEI